MDVSAMLAALTPERVELLRSLLKERESETPPAKPTHTDPSSVESMLSEPIPELTTAELIASIQSKMAAIDELTGKIGGGEPAKTKDWLDALLRDSVEVQEQAVNQTRDTLNEQFVRSLATIGSVRDFVKSYNSGTVDSLQIDEPFKSFAEDTHLKAIEDAANLYSCDMTYTDLAVKAESQIEKLRPALKECVGGLCERLGSFYSLLDMVDGYTCGGVDLQSLPTAEEVGKYAAMDTVDDLRDLMATRFKTLTPAISKQLAVETANLKKLVTERAVKLRGLQAQIKVLSGELATAEDSLDLNGYSTESELAAHVGLKQELIDKYSARVDELEALKRDRQDKLDSYMLRVGEMWSILRGSDDSIQQFLLHNRNLREESLKNFENLLTELEQEKKDNLAKFIDSSRERIKGYWDLLMYDDEERKQSFPDYWPANTADYTEERLDAHTAQIEKLRAEAETLKPLLQSIAALDKLLDEKRVLDESSKDPSRLLRRDAFKILRREEVSRNKLGKLLPSTIESLKLKLVEYENNGHRVLKIDNQPYANKLAEIEKHVLPRRSYLIHSPKRKERAAKVRSVSQGARPSRRPSSSTRRSNQRTRSLPSMRPRSYPSGATPARTPVSIIRRQTVDDLCNPFLSRNNSPVKRSKLNNGSPHRKSHDAKSHDVNPDEILQNLNTNSTVSNKPIVLKGGSPMRRHLDMATATKATTHTFRYPTMPVQAPVLSAPDSRKRKAEDAPPVEDLSDSLIYFSDHENNDKENAAPPPLVLNPATSGDPIM